MSSVHLLNKMKIRYIGCSIGRSSCSIAQNGLKPCCMEEPGRKDLFLSNKNEEEEEKEGRTRSEGVRKFELIEFCGEDSSIY